MQKSRPFRPTKQGLQRGSAVVEFVLISAPLVLLAVTSISVTLASFTLMILRDSAIEGARFAALADQESAAGCLRAREQINATFQGKLIAEIRCRTENENQEIVEITAGFSNLGLLGAHHLTATGRAFREK